MRQLPFLALLLVALAATAAESGGKKAGVVLGAADFLPTPEHPAGWRGDGTGRFPGATPPTTWSRTVKDGKAESSGVLWMTPIPGGASSPIVVGDRIFFGYGLHGLICLSKTDGRILWYRSHHYYDVMPDDQRKTIEDTCTAPAATIQAHLDAEMKRMSEAVSPAGYPPSKRFMDGPWWNQDAGLRKQLDDAAIAVDKDRYGTKPSWPTWHDWEWSAATPVSDGTYVYMWFSHRVAVCYDLAGKRIWVTTEPAKDIAYGETHGRFSSPVLAGDKFIIQYGHEVIAFERTTGKLAWHSSMTKTPHWITPLYSSLVPANVGGQSYVATCMGEVFRSSDGERGWGMFKDFSGESSSAIAENSRLFLYDRSGIIQLLFAAAPGPNAQATVGKSLRFDKAKSEYMVASPLFVDGLVYTVSDKGLLRAFDPEAGSAVYEKQLPLEPHIEYITYPGFSACPTLAGKYIYLLDNQGGTVVIEPGRAYKEVARNRLETFEKKNKEKDGREVNVNEQTVSNPVFDGKLLFIRGQQYLYCIGSR